jgi:hypothetical protein
MMKTTLAGALLRVSAVTGSVRYRSSTIQGRSRCCLSIAWATVRSRSEAVAVSVSTAEFGWFAKSV